MTHNLVKSTMVLLLGMALAAGVACKKSGTPTEVFDNAAINTSALRQQLQSSASSVMDQKEVESLLYMREEEKMARDVYLALSKKWNTRVFENISSAEQTHMDAVLLLLNKYNIQDPVGSNGPGVFTNQKLQALYNQLVTQGNVSVIEAFRTGASIEDLDIYDLQMALAVVQNADVKMVYGNLKRASENHLRAFYRNVLKAGGIYLPQYISQTEFDTIINS